jgi:formate-nitrite transporter family protein
MSTQTRRPRQDEDQEPGGDSAEERDRRASADAGSSADRAHESGALHPKLDEREQKEVEDRSAAPARVVYGAIQKEGEEELERPSSALAWSGLAAGLSMGFSFVVEALIHAMLPAEPWRPLLSKLGYSVGFLIVVLGRQQLFTENTLTRSCPS